MKLRLSIALILIVVVPLALLGWLGIRVAQNEREVIGHRFRALLVDRLIDIDGDIAAVLGGWERQLLAETQLTGLETRELRLRAMKSPIVRQYFVLDTKGNLTYPLSTAPLNETEKRFVVRTQDIWMNKEIPSQAVQEEVVQQVQSTKVPIKGGKGGTPQVVTKQAARPTAQRKGWHVWYWDNGLNLIFWWRESSGNIVGAEVSDVRLMADIVGALPETIEQDQYQSRMSQRTPPSQASRIKLLDSNSNLVYQWGLYEATEDEQPQAALALSQPLGSWKLQYYASEDSVYGGYGKGMLFNLLSGLGAVAVAMVVLAIYFYRESSRDMREATQRISFVNKVSHELKTPLTSIRMYAEMLAGQIDEENPKAKRHLSIIVSESQRLSRLIGNVLTFSRKQRSALKIHKSKGIIDEALREVLERSETGLASNGIQIEFHPGAGKALEFDRDILEQVMCNLLSNVEKYATSADLITVTSTQTQDTVTITFSDNGPGIPASEHKKIFDAFYRVSDKVNDGVAGTGIGLTIARELALLHGGDLVLQPREKGASFKFTLQVGKESNQ